MSLDLAPADALEAYQSQVPRLREEFAIKLEELRKAAERAGYLFTHRYLDDVTMAAKAEVRRRNGLAMRAVGELIESGWAPTSADQLKTTFIDCLSHRSFERDSFSDIYGALNGASAAIGQPVSEEAQLSFRQAIGKVQVDSADESVAALRMQSGMSIRLARSAEPNASLDTQGSADIDRVFRMATSEPLEEAFEGQVNGVERETDDDERDVRTPYDPKAIRVDPRVYSVRQILDMVDDSELDLAPDFQRLKVWKPWQKSSLIESLLLRIPLPAFYFSSDEEGLLQVVDGVQRLTTIFDYVRRDAFKLVGLEYLNDDVGDKTFSQIDNTIWSRRILNTQITAFVIDPQTPVRVKFDIFRRINTGGSPLNSQEIRHCMSRKRSRDFLRDLAAEESFKVATAGTLANDVRMVDRELALRFVAFRSLKDITDYEEFGSMDEFLTQVNSSLDEASAFSEQELERYGIWFRLGMSNATRVFGDYAFRKWFTYSDARYPINRSLFDVWSVELSKHPVEAIDASARAIQDAARVLMTENVEFINAISAGTGTPRKVITRFACVQALLRDILAAA